VEPSAVPGLGGNSGPLGVAIPRVGDDAVGRDRGGGAGIARQHDVHENVWLKDRFDLRLCYSQSLKSYTTVTFRDILPE